MRQRPPRRVPNWLPWLGFGVVLGLAVAIVPLIIPVAGTIDSPAGSPVAPNDVGLLLAVIW